MRHLSVVGLFIVLQQSASFSLLQLSRAQSFRREVLAASREEEGVTVTLKIALDQQGGVDDLTAKSFRFTSEDSLDLVHRLRACSDAIGVGIGTVRRDNPSLLVRRGVRCEKQPLRVIFDSTFTSARDAIVFSDHFPTLVFTLPRGSSCEAAPGESSCEMAPNKSVRELRASDREGLLEALEYLSREKQVKSLMVEGGVKLARSFLKLKLIDRAIVITAPVFFDQPVPSGGVPLI